MPCAGTNLANAKKGVEAEKPLEVLGAASIESSMSVEIFVPPFNFGANPFMMLFFEFSDSPGECITGLRD